MNNNTIGKLIAEIRKEKDMTQKELAEKLNITDRAVSKWERGICCPDISLLEDLSKILDVPIHNLISGKRNNEKITEDTITKTIKYANDSIRKKIFRISNNILIGIIIISLTLLVFFNIKLQIQFNSKYKTNFYPYILEKCLVNFDNIETNLDVISENQGKYSDEDYKYIINTINELKDNILVNKDRELLKRNYYSHNEIIDYYKRSINYNIYTDLYQNNIYHRLINYDKEIFNNLDGFYTSLNTYNNSLSNLQEFYINDNYYLYIFSKTKVANSVVNNLCSTYQLYNLLLENIIMAGEINE